MPLVLHGHRRAPPRVDVLLPAVHPLPRSCLTCPLRRRRYDTRPPSSDGSIPCCFSTSISSASLPRGAARHRRLPVAIPVIRVSRGLGRAGRLLRLLCPPLSMLRMSSPTAGRLQPPPTHYARGLPPVPWSLPPAFLLVLLCSFLSADPLRAPLLKVPPSAGPRPRGSSAFGMPASIARLLSVIS